MSTYVDVKLGIRRMIIVDHLVAVPTIAGAYKVDREGVQNSDLREYEVRTSQNIDLQLSNCCY